MNPFRLSWGKGSRQTNPNGSRLAFNLYRSRFGVEIYGSEMRQYWGLGCRFQGVYKGMALWWAEVDTDQHGCQIEWTQLPPTFLVNAASVLW